MKAIITAAPLMLLTQLSQAIEDTTKPAQQSDIIGIGLLLVGLICAIGGYFWYLKRANEKEEAAKKL